ncbi:MAG: hypothetical protein SFZ23_14435 [Planctomycetota bacterium]|nr:hypothetical protein [Planctomycetota bacterium]
MRARHVGCSCFTGAASLATSSALAQVGTATFTWQASADGGQTWQSNLIDVLPRQTMQIRGLFDWSPDAGLLMGGAGFDATIDGAGEDDAPDAFARREPFASNEPQTIVASRFGTTIKIDDSRDTRPPGNGTRGVRISQAWPDTGSPFTLDKPLVFLTFNFTIDASVISRIVSSTFRNGNTSDTPPFLWLRNNGGPNRPTTTTVPLTIPVIPAPGAAAFMTFGMLAAARRRR